ncbi:MAG: LptA/OstA family protein [Verrucomicrobiota bacterium]
MMGDVTPADLELPAIDLGALDPEGRAPSSALPKPNFSTAVAGWDKPILEDQSESQDLPVPSSQQESAEPSSDAATALTRSDTPDFSEPVISNEPPARIRDRAFVAESAPSPAPSDDIGLGNVNITAEDEVDFDLEAGTLVFRGNAAMENDRFKLKSDRIEVGMQQNGESGEALRTAVGVGNVVIEMVVTGAPSGYVGYCERAVYNPEDGSITLLGWPEIIGNGGRQVAATPETKVILFSDGRLKTYGRNKTYLTN